MESQDTKSHDVTDAVQWRATEEEALRDLIFVARITLKDTGDFVTQFKVTDGWSLEMESPDWELTPEGEGMVTKKLPNPIYAGFLRKKLN